MANPRHTVKIAESGDRAQMAVKIADGQTPAQCTLRVAESGDHAQFTVTIAESGDRAQLTVTLEGYSPGGGDGTQLDFSQAENSGHAGGTA